jgi:elongation factor G
MGELHLDIIIDRLKREYKLDVSVGEPQVAYKETIKSTVKSEGKYIKQTGGRGQYGHVWLEVSPGDEEFVFNTKIVGGAIPKEFIGSIKKGIVESLGRGYIAGYPLININVLVFDGSYHDVDSSDIAFKIAASMAFKKAVSQADPIILEPIMNAEVTTPEKWLGDVISDLNSRRGRIISIVERGQIKVVKCFVPLSEMFGFASDIRSKTQGRATYTMEFHKYLQVPKSIEEKIAKK